MIFLKYKVILYYIFLFTSSAATAAIEGKLGKGLKKMLKKMAAKEAIDKLAVADAKLGNIIKVKNKLTLWLAGKAVGTAVAVQVLYLEVGSFEPHVVHFRPGSYSSSCIVDAL